MYRALNSWILPLRDDETLRFWTCRTTWKIHRLLVLISKIPRGVNSNYGRIKR